MPPLAAPLERPSYDQDFHAWALDQAARLRRMPAERVNEPIDWEQLAEEVEDLAKRERLKSISFLEHVIEHLLKIEHARDPEPIPHWVREVRAFRKNFRRVTSPSVEARLRADLAEHYAAAREDAEAAMLRDPTFLDRAPRTCPYSYEQIAGDWLPERAAG